MKEIWSSEITGYAAGLLRITPADNARAITVPSILARIETGYVAPNKSDVVFAAEFVDAIVAYFDLPEDPASTRIPEVTQFTTWNHPNPGQWSAGAGSRVSSLGWNECSQ